MMSHAAHVLEETRPAEDGVQFLSGSRSDWSDTTYNNHLTWHLTLYHLGGCGLAHCETVGLLSTFTLSRNDQ